ncbi:uncharacterized protein ighd [Hoplias malabaricus]|uniref:uncharacterized protein ighd n=1 Tax=Hoplias malabaricus TaxID=27720 RepID=UPI0034625C32
MEGFYPEQGINLQWFVDQKKLSGSPVKKLKSQSQDKSQDETFTQISEIHVKKEQWNTNSTYTCKASRGTTSQTEEWSICKAFSMSKPRIRVEEPRIASLTKVSQTATATCVVDAIPSANVLWLLDSEEVPNTSEERDDGLGGKTQQIIKNLTLTVAQWESANSVICKVQHPCYQNDTEEHVKFIEPWKGTPKVEIRRPFVDKESEDKNVLECFARDLPSGLHAVTFRANTTLLPPSQEVDLPKGQGQLITRITVPETYRKKDFIFSCEVRQSPSRKWESTPTGHIYGDASVELSMVPSTVAINPEAPKLLCSGIGFKPNVEWYNQSKKMKDVPYQVMMQNDGRMKVSSEIQAPLQEWNKGMEITCQITDLSKNVQKNISNPAANSVFIPRIRVDKPRIVSLTGTSDKATATCVVEALPNSKVLWNSGKTEWKDAETKEDGTSGKIKQIISTLRLSANEWENVNNITCTVQHPHYQSRHYETVSFVGSSEKRPIVEIRRPFVDNPSGDKNVLECFARDLPFGLHAVTFRANTTLLPPSQEVDLPKGQEQLITRITVPDAYHKKDFIFSCEVRQSPSRKWESKHTGRIYDDPSMELSVIPSTGNVKSEPQKLLCSGIGFNPSIKWLNPSVKIHHLPVTMQANGQMKVSSEIEAPLNRWNQGEKFTCKITDGQKTSQKEISDCAVTSPSTYLADVYLLGPSLSDSRSQNVMHLTCLVIGHSVKDFSITWKGKGINPNKVSQGSLKDHPNGTQSVQSSLELSSELWNSYTCVFCEVKHRCSERVQFQNISKVRDPKPPTVRIIPPSDSDLSTSRKPILLCLVTGFYPADISVYWEQDGMKLDKENFINSPVSIYSPEKELSMHSALFLPQTRQESRSFSCVVKHESSKEPITKKMDNVYASVITSAPSVEILQARDELVCLVFNYSPSAVNITWLLDGSTVEKTFNISSPAKGPDGKFSVKSQLHILASDWPPGSTYTCQVQHVSGISTRKISKTEMMLKTLYIDENMSEYKAEDTPEENWNMAFAFIILFLLSLVYGCCVTLIKIRTG